MLIKEQVKDHRRKNQQEHGNLKKPKDKQIKLVSTMIQRMTMPRKQNSGPDLKSLLFSTQSIKSTKSYNVISKSVRTYINWAVTMLSGNEVEPLAHRAAVFSVRTEKIVSQYKLDVHCSLL